MLLRAAESHTTPNKAGKARQAQNWGGAHLRLIKPPTSNIDTKNLFLVMTNIETSTHETFSGSPYAGCWLAWHLESPIDFGWELLQSATYAAEHTAPHWDYCCAEARSGLLQHAAYLGSFFQIIANNSWGELSDMHTWKVIAVPTNKNSVEIQGFVWKVGNNGDTFVALKQKYAKTIETICLPSERDDIGLFMIYGQDSKSRTDEGIK